MKREKMNLQEKIRKTIQDYNLIQKNDKILIGVSGGPDSMCLLDVLCHLKENLTIQIAVAHINHMIRPEAEEETKYVQTYCEKNQIPCFVKYANVVKIAKEQKLGTEEMGRKIRYEFFEEISQKIGASKIATAHNSNDNAETVLMNLLRGSGTAGLKGIEIARKTSTVTYIRPLKECSRQEIEAYCKQASLNPKIDKSNVENIYTRNKIRNELIPYLQKEFNPNIIETLNRLSHIANEENHYFAKIVEEEYETLKIGENKGEIILALKGLNNLPKVIKSKLILYTINKTIGSTQGIQKVNIEDILKLCENNIGNKYLMPNKNIKVFINQGKIHFISKANLP